MYLFHIFRFFTWNLFLAAIPVALAYFISALARRRRGRLSAGILLLGALWLSSCPIPVIC